MDDNLVPGLRTIISNKNDFFIEISELAWGKLFGDEVLSKARKFLNQRQQNIEPIRLDEKTWFHFTQIYDKLGFTIKNTEANVQISFLGPTFEKLITFQQMIEGYIKELINTSPSTKIEIQRCKLLFENHFYAGDTSEKVLTKVLKNLKETYVNPLQLEIIVLFYKKIHTIVQEEKRRELLNADV